jgi:ubiquinone biosynthesis protein UbiJ
LSGGRDDLARVETLCAIARFLRHSAASEKHDLHQNSLRTLCRRVTEDRRESAPLRAVQRRREEIAMTYDQAEQIIALLRTISHDLNMVLIVVSVYLAVWALWRT